MPQISSPLPPVKLSEPTLFTRLSLLELTPSNVFMEQKLLSTQVPQQNLTLVYKPSLSQVIQTPLKAVVVSIPTKALLFRTK